MQMEIVAHSDVFRTPWCYWFSSSLNLNCQGHVRPPVCFWFGACQILKLHQSLFMPLVQFSFKSKLSVPCHASLFAFGSVPLKF